MSFIKEGRKQRVTGIFYIIELMVQGQSVEVFDSPLIALLTFIPPKIFLCDNFLCSRICFPVCLSLTSGVLR